MASKYQPVTPEEFVSPLPVGNFYFSSAHTVFPYVSHYGSAGATVTNIYTQIITDQNGKELFNHEYRVQVFHDREEPIGNDIGGTISLQSGQTYTVKYNFRYPDSAPAPADYKNYNISATYKFRVVDNKLPLKKWTITDVINRTLDLAEPIRLGETPRFKLNEEQAAMFANVLAPQFSFTKQTLRECLQECGKVIHGEPRLDKRCHNKE